MAQTPPVQAIDKGNLPLIKGSTAFILRTLYESQIGKRDVKADGELIKLDALAASTKFSLPTTTSLVQMREHTDEGIAKFSQEKDNVKIGAQYKQQNTEISVKISQLTETYGQLNEQYLLVKKLQEAVREKLSKSPNQPLSNEKMAQLKKETRNFLDAVKAYKDKHDAIRHELHTLFKTVQHYVPGKEPGATPTPQ